MKAAPLPDAWIERARSAHGASLDSTADGHIAEGARNNTLASFAGLLRRSGLSEAGITDGLLALNARLCVPPLDDAEVGGIARSVARYPAQTSPSSRSVQSEWPLAMSKAAFHGLAGEIVRALEPHSEADPAALLVQTLTAFGNLAGRTNYVLVESDRHPGLLYAVIVGETSKSRKGTSWSRVRSVCEQADAEWLRECVTGGAVSGEGLIWEVRDPVSKQVPVKEGKDDGAQGTQRVIEELVDPGVADKRRLWHAAEFAAILKAASRDSNTLSPTMRDLWDRGDHRTAAKNSPARTTGAHTSIIAHITAEELRRLLTETEIANGFANRFLFVCARRSKELPEPTQPEPASVAALGTRLRRAARFASEVRELRRDEGARELWADVYGPLSAGGAGMLGAVTSRAEAQVTRLSLIYALLDCAQVIREEHLRAALAVWDYCYRSAAWIFGDALGSSVADTLLGALRQSPNGLTRSKMRDMLGGRVRGERIGTALDLLRQHGLGRCERRATGGRPVEHWYAVDGTEETEQTPARDGLSYVSYVPSTAAPTP